MTDLLFLHFARRLIVVDTCIKFREYSLSGFQVIEHSARHLMLIDIV